MDEQKQDDQLEPIYNSSVLIQDVVLKTFRERCKIENSGEWGFGRSVLAAQYDDDDDIYIYCRELWFLLAHNGGPNIAVLLIIAKY